jgi:hypothetical protein
MHVRAGFKSLLQHIWEQQEQQVKAGAASTSAAKAGAEHGAQQHMQKGQDILACDLGLGISGKAGTFVRGRTKTGDAEARIFVCTVVSKVVMVLSPEQGVKLLGLPVACWVNRSAQARAKWAGLIYTGWQGIGVGWWHQQQCE